MENKFRNELEIKIGGETILLRPTFENIAAMESDIGGLAYLGWKFSRGMRLGADGKVTKASMLSEASIRATPTLTECTKVIYYNQAASKPEDATQKKFNLEEIWALVSKEGVAIVKPVTIYLAQVTAGDKKENDEPEGIEPKNE